MEVSLTPLALVDRGLSLFPDRLAVVDEGYALTYAELRGRVERLAGALRELGVEAGDRVALLAPNTACALECYTGVPLSGAVLVPLNTRLAAGEYAYILGHSGARVLLVDAALYPQVAPVLRGFPDLRVVVQGERLPGALAYEDLLAAARPVPFDAEAVDERAVVSLNYTSGTTARPKGVMITHRNAYVNAVNMVLALRLAREDVHLHVAPMFHADGWGFVWATFAVGATNVPLPRVRGEEILRKAARFGVTTLCAAPTVLSMILEASRSVPAPSGVRVATAGAAPPREIVRRVEDELGWHITHFYGLTETTAFLTYAEEPAELATWSRSEQVAFKARQGVPLLGAGRVRVVRPDMTDVRRDGHEVGEVVGRGNVIMAGYFRDPQATEAALAGGWFHTGDLAVWHPDGTIEVRDRAKDVIISGGENIPSLEVENALYEHPAVRAAAVVAAPHPLWGETPVAFVALQEGSAVDSAELIAYCRERLAHFKVPRHIVFLPELPRTASGKVQKFLLRARASELARTLWGEASEKRPGADVPAASSGKPAPDRGA